MGKIRQIILKSDSNGSGGVDDDNNNIPDDLLQRIQRLSLNDFKNGGGGGYSPPIYHGCKRIFKVVAVYKCVLYKSRIVCVCVLNREEI